MLPFLLAAPALAMNVDLQYQPPDGRDVFVQFTDVEVGVERVVEVPCGKAPTCRLGVTVTPREEKWLLVVTVDEVRDPLLGREKVERVVAPTFLLGSGAVVSFFSGRQAPIPGTDPVTWSFGGIHMQAFVTPTVSTAAK
jgi:hypothetical protein